MGVTISINGLSLIHQASNGASTATLPNVCHTPSAGPVPYGSVARSRDLAGGTQSVRVDGGFSAATARSVFAVSVGDEAGVQGGVISGVRGAESSFLTFSPDVRLEGSPAGRLTDKMLNNHGNTVNAGGATNDPGKKGRGKPSKTQVEKVLVTVLGEDKKRVHAPFTVFLKPVKKGKGRKYQAVTHKSSGPVAFYNVEKAKYRVIVVHDCYPEAIAELTVDARVERVKIQLARVDLKAVAKEVRLGVRFSGYMDTAQMAGQIADIEAQKAQNPAEAAKYDQAITTLRKDVEDEPSHKLGAQQQFHDLVLPTFWQRYEADEYDQAVEANYGQFSGDFADKIVGPAQLAGALGMGVEATPLFWCYAFAGDQVVSTTSTGKKKVKVIPWGPNPVWLKKVGAPAQALKLVKSFITKVAKAFKDRNLLGQVKRWVVINEPMNIIMRDVCRDAPFLKALLPTVEDTGYAKKEVKKLKGRHKKVPARVKLAPQAIANMVELLKHAHAELPGDSLLIVNDYGIEGCDGEHGLMGMRAQRFRELMAGVLAGVKDTPGLTQRLRVGMQAHLKSGGELGADAGGGENNDFRVSSVRKQMKWLKARNLRVCVTECDLLLDDVKYKVKVKKKQVTKEGLHEHIEQGTAVVPGKGRKKKPGFSAQAFFDHKVRRRPYLKAFAAQRLDLRDLMAAMLGGGNVDSFVWWDFDDDLPDDAGGSNFRYHGYLYHRYLVCAHCKSQASMQVHDDSGITYYKKPCYWGAVAAFQSPGAGFAR